MQINKTIKQQKQAFLSEILHFWAWSALSGRRADGEAQSALKSRWTGTNGGKKFRTKSSGLKGESMVDCWADGNGM